MIQLTLHSNNENKASAITRAERWSNPEVYSWLCATQVWTFSGTDHEGRPVEGDAICIVTGRITNTRNMIVVRLGKNAPKVVEYIGIKPLLEAYGFVVAPDVIPGPHSEESHLPF